MTWNELIEEIKTWTPEQRGTEVTVFEAQSDEFYKVTTAAFNDPGEHGSAALDDNHPYLVIDA